MLPPCVVVLQGNLPEEIVIGLHVPVADKVPISADNPERLDRFPAPVGDVENGFHVHSDSCLRCIAASALASRALCSAKRAIAYWRSFTALPM